MILKPELQAHYFNEICKSKAGTQEAFGQLVLLSFVISDFTPAAYQGHRL